MTSSVVPPATSNFCCFTNAGGASSRFSVLPCTVVSKIVNSPNGPSNDRTNAAVTVCSFATS
jgi:hypothetical protein